MRGSRFTYHTRWYSARSRAWTITKKLLRTATGSA